MDWQQAKAEFECDGSLRDLYILNADVEVWQRVIDSLRSSEYPCRYQVDDNDRPLPGSVEDVFKKRQEAGFLLSVDVDGILLNCHFFTEEEVEFDLDPREIDSREKLQALFRFMRRIGQAAGRHVIMTPENRTDIVVFQCSPESGAIRHAPFGGWS
jgi:hypothetical protein